MSKLAIFVEGLTERLFVERLIVEIAGKHNVRIRIEDVTGNRGIRQIRLFSEDSDTGQRGYVLIRDCHGDHNVASDIRDQYANLAASGYNGIIGLRDLYPRPLTDLPILLGLDRRSLNFKLKTDPIRVKWIFAVMEIEAWFLAEHTHFARLHPNLVPDRILQELGFDPRTDDMEARPRPAGDLQSIYNLEGLTYDKTLSDLTRTINALDIAMIHSEMSHVQNLRQLIDVIDNLVTMCISQQSNGV